MHERETRKPRFWPRHRSQRHAGNLLLLLLLATRLANAQAFLPAVDSVAAGCASMLVQTSEPSDRTPREVIVVIERSTSMRGWRFRRALRQAQRELANLRATDRFNLVVYADSTDVLYARPAPALAANIAEARQWLRGLRTGGDASQRSTALHYATWVPGAAGYGREIVLADAVSAFATAEDLQRPNRDYGFAGADIRL
ncbi:MAG: hypothetical protein Q8L45_12580 [Xanthomonadaceae bacterium]|nr:hypothetical protein [Xanthomonadaceae bacterium]MDP2184118.1 hypothetical protein [Xanthomonadales bacterium]MDZ4116095.1 hypothetical protein [Xanthomonadaceae bacterium]MDZ4377215.1 hypothetical protein [Xanthomonadaceae bacterium]